MQPGGASQAKAPPARLDTVASESERALFDELVRCSWDHPRSLLSAGLRVERSIVGVTLSLLLLLKKSPR